MNLGYKNRRIASMRYRLRIVSLAWVSKNLFAKPKTGYNRCRIGNRVYCSEVRINSLQSVTSKSGSPFSKRVARVPYATRPFQTAINMRYSPLLKNKNVGGSQRLKPWEKKERRWKRRLANRLAYLLGFEIGYLNSLRTTGRSIRSTKLSKDISSR